MKLEALRTSTSNRLLLVDGHAYAYRAFFAIRHLASPTHQPTNAIYGFISMLNGMIEATQPTHFCVVWDGGLSPERTQLLPQYKAQRPSMPEDLRSQFDPLASYLRADGFESFCQDGVEADDYIGCLALHGAQAGFTVIVASPDKDFMQLVSSQVLIFNPKEKGGDLMGPEAVIQKTGVRPSQVVDWLSLVGDSADNIPGVPGIGPKTAAQLLVAYDSIDGIYARLDEVQPARVKDLLAASKHVAFMNRELTRLQTDIACDFSEARFSRRKRDLPALRALYQSWGFRKLLAGLDADQLHTPELALQ